MSTHLPSHRTARAGAHQPSVSARAASPYESLATVTEAAIEGIFARAECAGCAHPLHGAFSCTVIPFFALSGNRCRCTFQDGRWPE